MNQMLYMIVLNNAQTHWNKFMQNFWSTQKRITKVIGNILEMPLAFDPFRIGHYPDNVIRL